MPISAVAMGVNCGTSLLGIVFATVLRMILVRLNKKLDREEDLSETGLTAEGQAGRREEQGLPGEAAAKGFRFLI